LAKWVAERLELDKQTIQDIEYSALLHEIGKLSIPKEVISKKYKNMTEKERDMLKQHPIVGQLCLSSAPKLRMASMNIRHELENFDGTGTPDHLVENEIPIGSRILRAIIDYEDLIEEYSNSIPAVITTMQRGVRTKYDPKILQMIINFTEESTNPLMAEDKQKINVFDLKDGMTLAQDLYTSAGIKLLPKGANIKEHMVEKIVSHNSRDPIVGGVYVFKSFKSEE
jgi:response regulator RpfG family c-di-GMP phosphodiesterase